MGNSMVLGLRIQYKSQSEKIHLYSYRCLTREVQTESKFFTISNLGNKDDFFRIDFYTVYALKWSDGRGF